MGVATNTIEKTLANIAAQPDEDLKWSKIEDLATDLFQEGASLGAIKGFTVDEIEAAYSVAYSFYQQGKYEDARKLFQYFSTFEHTDRRFWMGLAASLQKLRQYEKAILAYGAASLLDVSDPAPPFHAAECHIAIKDWENARKALEATLTIAEGEKEHVAYAKQANTLLSVVDKDEKR